jgi:Histidine kinase-, DNA gyrase B-, and HSP90-like ATPase
VLANLLANALRHTPPGGRVEVAATITADRHLQVSVTDTGEGIPPELLERIFERFYRVDRARTHTPNTGGSGIGLTITRAIVHAHGGQIHAHSQGSGQGARFDITLPQPAPADPPRPGRTLNRVLPPTSCRSTMPGAGGRWMARPVALGPGPQHRRRQPRELFRKAR